MDPHACPRRILLAVTGLSPQVVTETIYALAVEQSPAFVPTEVHLITTGDGATHAERTLLTGGEGRLEALCRDYGLPAIQLERSHIHVLQDAEDEVLSDIRTPGENRLAADLITDTVRQLTRDDNSALHVSIAGGRKTMGFYLGYALSLFGRPQDRLSHVLVNAPFESHPDFFYPPPAPATLHPRAGAPVSTRDAQVLLAEIPFVQMRHWLPADLFKQAADFGAAVDAARQSLAPPRLEIDLEARSVYCGGVKVPMGTSVLAFYAWLAWRRQKAIEPVTWRDADTTKLLSLYARIVGEFSGHYDRMAKALQDGLQKDYLLEKNSRVNRALYQSLGENAHPYRIISEGRRPHTRYGLKLEPEAIRLIP